MHKGVDIAKASLLSFAYFLTKLYLGIRGYSHV